MTYTKQIKVRFLQSAETTEIFTYLEDVIVYFQKLIDANPGKKLYLEDQWSGYEDVHYEIRYEELETDDEFNRRVDLEEQVKKNIRDREDKVRDQQRAELVRQKELIDRKLKDLK